MMHGQGLPWRAITEPLRDERVRFLLAGGWNTVFGLLAFAFVDASSGARLGTLGTLLFAYAIALPQAFFVHKYLVFRRAHGGRRQWHRFAVANSLVFVANLALVPAAVALTAWPPLAVQAGFVAISTVSSWFVHRHWSFA